MYVVCMPYLPFISDDDLKTHVSRVLEAGIEANKNKDTKFHSNVIDPFGPIFELAVNDFSSTEWEKSEKSRQTQKTLQNEIGDFHNYILGSVKGWKRLAKGNEIDLIKDDKSVIAEIKNKHNTVSGGKLVDHYVEFDNLVNKKASKYFKATAYYVKIIPKKPIIFDIPFTPPDKASGNRKPIDQQIREIDGRSFYKLVTGIDDALDQLHRAIPNVINDLGKKKGGYNKQDKIDLNNYFKKAYIPPA